MQFDQDECDEDKQQWVHSNGIVKCQYLLVSS